MRPTKKPTRPQSRKVVEVYGPAESLNGFFDFDEYGELRIRGGLLKENRYPSDHLHRITIERIEERKKK